MLSHKFPIVLALWKIVLSTCSFTDIRFNCSIVTDSDSEKKSCINMNLKSYTFLTKVNSVNIESPEEISSLFLTSKFMHFLPRDLFKYFGNVEEFGVSTALPQILSITNQTFTGASNLRSIYIVGQRLHSLGANTFEGAPNIVQLFLPSNQIESIDEKAFDDMSKCSYLVLSNNRITSLKAMTFTKMASLWSINLGLNHLSSLESKLFAFNNLTVLDLSYNRMNSLPEEIVKMFLESTNDRKVLSMIGNICSDKIFTKKSTQSEVMKSLEVCLNPTIILPERTQEETLKLQDKVKELETENEELKSHLESVCSKRIQSVDAEFEKGKNFLKELTANIVQWKAKHRMIQISLEEWKKEHGEIDSCTALSRPLGCLKPLENEISTSINIIKELRKKNLQLSREIDNLVLTVQKKMSTEKSVDIEQQQPSQILKSMENFTATAAERSNETGTCNELVEKLQQQVLALESQSFDSTTRSLSVERNEAPMCNNNELVEKLQQQVLALESQSQSNNSTDYCGDFETTKELKELKNKITEKDNIIAKMNKVYKLMTKEAKKIDEEKHENVVEKLELKEDIADCKTMRNVDSINITSIKTKLKVNIIDEEMNDIMGNLRKLISIRLRNLDEDGFELEDLVEQKVYEIWPERRVNDEIDDLKNQIFARYKIFEENEEKFELILSELNNLINFQQGFQSIHLKINEKVRELNQIITEQYQLLNNGGLEIYHLIHDTKVNLQPLNLIRRDGKASVTDTLKQLQENVMEKDEILRGKYRFIEDMVGQIEESRDDASKAIVELERVKKEASKIPMMDDEINDMIKSDDKKKDCMNEEMNQTITLQRERITELVKEKEIKEEKLKRASKIQRELLKRCESCRGVWSKIKGWFVAKNNCDFLS